MLNRKIAGVTIGQILIALVVVAGGVGLYAFVNKKWQENKSKIMPKKEPEKV